LIWPTRRNTSPFEERDEKKRDRRSTRHKGMS
jgi:hypothetical protein